MELHITDPLSDRRWHALASTHSSASAFHQRGWLEALHRTYHYRPFVLTSASANAQMKDGVVLCEVKSWITGTRAVSLPFSDHCELLLQGVQQFPEMIRYLIANRERQGWRFAEIRPLTEPGKMEELAEPSRSYWFHELDLRPSLEELFRNLHKDSIQRRIRHAESEGLSYTKGRSPDLLVSFYRLLLLTRKRQGVLPQPFAWFRNLVTCLGDDAEIRLAAKDGTPIGAILTLKHNTTVLYKYGCSDERFHSLGAMPFLFWKIIEEIKLSGAEKLDFGRTDLTHESLISFKDKFGTRKRLLNYYRMPQATGNRISSRANHSLRRVVSLLPSFASSLVADLVYRHVG
jgi:hypothetical protein